MPTPPMATVAGHVVRLDTAELRARGDCTTNAEVGPHGDRAVVGMQDFLVLHADPASGMCTAVPLFSKTAVGNQPLVEAFKSGNAEGWRGADVYFSRWQHWHIPVAVIEDVLAADTSSPESRRRYVGPDSSVLDDIRAWETRNRSAYRLA